MFKILIIHIRLRAFRGGFTLTAHTCSRARQDCHAAEHSSTWTSQPFIFISVKNTQARSWCTTAHLAIFVFPSFKTIYTTSSQIGDIIEAFLYTCVRVYVFHSPPLLLERTPGKEIMTPKMSCGYDRKTAAKAPVGAVKTSVRIWGFLVD